MATLDSFYAFPPADDDDDGKIYLIRTDEESFQCHDHIFYHVCSGPNPRSAECDENDTESFPVGNMICYAMALCGILFLVLQKLRAGLHNQLLGMVAFRDKEKNIPFKFSLAFTLTCNYRAGLASFFFSSACGRLSDATVQADFGNNFQLTHFFNGIFIIAFFPVFLAGFTYIVFLGFREWCCRQRRDENCECTEAFWIFLRNLAFRLMRICIVIMVFANILVRILSLGLEWEVDFDFSFPNWALSSLIGLIDALVSAGVEFYFFWKNHYRQKDGDDEVNDLDDKIKTLEPFAMDAAEDLADRMQLHRDVNCDYCQMRPIRGTRYHCDVGKHDYCSQCYKKNNGACPIDGVALHVYGQSPEEQHPKSGGPMMEANVMHEREYDC